MKFLLAILEVSDLNRSLAFYRDILGLPVVKQFSNQRGDQIAMLGENGSALIELVCKGRKIEYDFRSGMAVSFAVENAREIIEKNGGLFEGPFAPGPDMRFYFTGDPDGYRVQLQEILR